MCRNPWERVGLTGQLNGNKVASVCPRGVINKPGILECPRSSLGPGSNKWRAHTQTYVYIYIYVCAYFFLSFIICIIP